MRVTTERRFNILVVDDTPENVELLDEILRGNYRVRAALNGPRALELARGEDRPDLILLDVMMPGMDGLEVCRQLKADHRTRTIPVIFVTARSEVEDEKIGFKLGAVDYITKPISPPIVEARVQSHITLAHSKRMLERMVAVRTRELAGANKQLEQEMRSRAQAMSRAEFVSQHDALTGLPNRRSLLESIRPALTRAKEQGHALALLHMNLDRLQSVNNSLGTSVGDELLVRTARRLLKDTQTNDLVARDGGDNFVVVFDRGWQSASDAQEAADAASLDILDKLAAPHAMEDRTVRLGASAGLTIFPRDGDEGADLLTRAQIATSVAKKLGGDRLETYSPKMGTGSKARYSMEAHLRDALDTKQLDIHFQPQCELATRRIVGAEALVRWPDGSGGFISNASFIPLAEEAGLILTLDHYVLRMLCQYILDWEDRLPRDFRFAFNFSPLCFQDANSIQRALDLVAEMGVDPTRLELEVTEYAVIADVSTAVEKLRQVREFGIRVALDDFGTGYSSLAYLKTLPLDKLKIDGAFVQDVENDNRSASIARTIIVLANTLRLDVVAEGIENQAQLEFVRKCGCRHGQGFDLHGPLAATDLLKLLP